MLFSICSTCLDVVVVCHAFELDINLKANTIIKKRAAAAAAAANIYVAIYGLNVTWNDPFSANGMRKMQIKLNSSTINKMSEMFEWLSGCFWFWVGLSWAVDHMRIRSQFGIFIAMKMDVNQFIYPENLRPTTLDNSNYPHRTPASTHSSSINLHTFFLSCRHHRHRFIYRIYRIWIFRWDRRNFAVAVFVQSNRFTTSLYPIGVWHYIYTQGGWRRANVCMRAY